MADILTIGTKSLINMQHALTTTGHNITNANTDGYSRQQVSMDAASYRQYGFGFLGQGANVGSVDRVFDSLVSNQLNGFISTSSQYESFVAFNNRLNDMFADPQNSLNSSIQNLFSAVQEVSSSPSGMAQREVLLGDAQNLVYRQQSINKVLTSLGQEINDEIRMKVDELNTTVDNIGRLNKQIVSATATGMGAQPNDLLDERDRQIRKLAEMVSVNAVKQADGAMNVFVGNGQGLVIGTQTVHLEVRANAYDGSKVEIGLQGQPQSSNISRFINGGELQGLMDFQNRSLEQARDSLGLIVLTISEAFNTQQKLGLDIDGKAGGNFFSYSQPTIKPHSNNSGSAVPAVTIQTASDIRASDYRLSYNGTQWELSRLSDNTTVSGSGPLNLDGMSVDVSSGTPAANDSFVFNPARDAAASFELAITDARSFAAASALVLDKSAGNKGSGNLSALTVTGPAFIPLSAAVTLDYSADALGPGLSGFLVNGGVDGTIAYDPISDGAGKSFTVGTLGVAFTVTGVPSENDSFSLSHNTGAKGDNGNAVLMAELQNKKMVNGALSTLQQQYGALVSKIGISGRQAETNLMVESTLKQQAENYHLSISGVNLDEEASNLIKYQQAYQASAQVVKIATEIFQTLLNSIG